MIRVLLFSLLFAKIANAQTVGPCIGSLGPTEAFFLYRPGEFEIDLELSVLNQEGEIVSTDEATALKADDFVAKFHIKGLLSATRYRYQILNQTSSNIIAGGDDLTFKTTDSSRGDRVSAALISCVSAKDTAPVWVEIGKLKPDLLYLGGDTPYIDTPNLAEVRKKHRALLNEPPLARIIRNTPTVGMWDDHDFGLNNGNGKNFEGGKAATRKGFVEYRAHRQYGNGAAGVYHKTDLGVVEFFHLDPRWFSQLAPSSVDPQQTSCFGEEQWQWLLKSLKESKALFKVLSIGGIWQDKKNSETDDMFTYWYERDALLDFVKHEGISGVVLHGGDIHVSRYLVHPHRVGYDLHDFIMSPGHKRIIPSLNVYHPSLEWSLVEGQQFLFLEADPTSADPTLTVTYRQPGGKVNKKIILKLSDLTPPIREETLRAHWSFDQDFSNSSILGKRLDGSPQNGAKISEGALQLERVRGQFVNIPRSFLDDNSAGHSVSCWIRPNKLPVSGSKDRQFIFETTAEGKPASKAAYHLSLELSPASESENIAIRLHTQTLSPGGPQKAPVAKAQGAFQSSHLRSEIEGKWSHLVVCFDSKHLKVFLNGQIIATHTLEYPGPAAEHGGLVIGGHRAGTGRNFEGKIDELTIWQDVLDVVEVRKLYQKGL
ncbi:MAG TPA: alkaline phosphatase [Verrucomicrobiales bacterium]|nr:alkaline phosphatase [Verrucomicrobiales bacterium]